MRHCSSISGSPFIMHPSNSHPNSYLFIPPSPININKRLSFGAPPNNLGRTIQFEIRFNNIWIHSMESSINHSWTVNLYQIHISNQSSLENVLRGCPNLCHPLLFIFNSSDIRSDNRTLYNWKSGRFSLF